MQVEGKNIVVTGGASGIGKALVERFAQEGAQVIVADRSRDKAQAVADAIGGLAVGCDVTAEQQVQNLVAKAQDQLGAIDLFALTLACVSVRRILRPRPPMSSGRPAGMCMSWRTFTRQERYCQR